ncbi:Sugar transporter STL1, partial [Pseudocercospora fuligena]
MFGLGGDNRYFGLRGGWLTFWVTVACGTDMTLFGYDQGVFGGVVVTEDFIQTLGLEGNSSLLGTVTAIYDIGCFFGAILAYFIGDLLGRKKCVLLGTTIMSIGAILQITAYGVPQMIVGRIIGGIGNGLNTSTAPPWQAETSKAAWRGKLIVIELILNIAGFSLSNWVTFGFSYAGGAIAWRVPLALQFIFIAILYGTVPWLPESPRWLVQKDRHEEAEQILADIEGTETEDPYVQTELNEIKFSTQYEREHSVRIRDLVRGKKGDQENAGTCTLRRVILGMGAQAIQQLSGINVTSYYLPTVLINSVGFDNRMARLLAAVNSVSYLLFSLIGIPNVERWGRRKMLMYAAAGQCFCYLIITVLLRYASLPGYGAQREVASAIPIYSQNTEASANRFFHQVVEITPIGIDTLGWKFYIIWTVLNFSFVPIVYLFFPETAGRTLEDIDEYFRTHNQPKDVLVFRDKVATRSSRPLEYIEKEESQVRRHSSVNPRAASLAMMHNRSKRNSVVSAEEGMGMGRRDLGESEKIEEQGTKHKEIR